MESNAGYSCTRLYSKMAKDSNTMMAVNNKQAN